MVEFYRKHEQLLLADIAFHLAFKLLRDDPQACLIVTCTVQVARWARATGRQTVAHSPLDSQETSMLSLLTIEDSDTPLVRPLRRALLYARIFFSSQSLGTADNTAVAQHRAQQRPALVFAGLYSDLHSYVRDRWST